MTEIAAIVFLLIMITGAGVLTAGMWWLGGVWGALGFLALLWLLIRIADFFGAGGDAALDPTDNVFSQALPGDTSHRKDQDERD